MSEDTPAGNIPLPDPEPSPEPAPAGVTPGGYSYTVVGAADQPAEPAPKERREPRRVTLPPLVLALAVLVPALLAAAGAWYASSLFDDDVGGADARVSGNVSNVINAFSQNAPSVDVRQFEGTLPPGFPDDIPSYPGANVVSSVVQIDGDDALYLIVYDTRDARADVSAHLSEALETDPWQIDAGRDSRRDTFRQFSKIDDPDVTGIVLITDSQEHDLTTVVLSVEVVSGGDDAGESEFAPPVSGTLPQGFPDVPQYPDSILIDAAFSHQPRADSYAVSLIARDDAEAALDYYRREFGTRGWSVEDGDPSESDLDGAQTIAFAGADDGVDGRVTAGEFPEDRNYVQIDIEVSVTE